MRLTIVNLVIQGQRVSERTERSASILARIFGKLNPPYAGCRIAANATYEVWRQAGCKTTSFLRKQGPIRRLSSGVDSRHLPQPSKPVVIAPCFRRDDEYTHTAILRCRTGAPAVRPSAASMMALASMPWWR